MNINVSPKDQFLEKFELAKDFRAMVLNPAMQTAVTHALAEMGISARFNSEQMQAVKHFVHMFMNMGERDSLPPRILSSHVEYPVRPEPGKKPTTQIKPASN